MIKLTAEIYKGNFKYKYMEYGEGAKFLIKNATMKFTDPRDFNDPFDCIPSYTLEDEVELLKKDKDLIKKAADNLGYSPSKRIMARGQIIANIKLSLDNGSWQNSICNDIGVCSLTTKACNLLMWAHYGDNHKGIVAEFKNEIPVNPDHSEEYLCSFHVKYNDKKPIIELSQSDFVHDLLIKGIDWKYEDEIRCLDMHRRAGIHKYRRDLLESIILGVNFEERKVNEIKLLIDKVNNKFKLNIKLYKVKKVKNKFKLFIPDHPVYGQSTW